MKKKPIEIQGVLKVIDVTSNSVSTKTIEYLLDRYMTFEDKRLGNGDIIDIREASWDLDGPRHPVKPFVFSEIKALARAAHTKGATYVRFIF